VHCCGVFSIQWPLAPGDTPGTFCLLQAVRASGYNFAHNLVRTAVEGDVQQTRLHAAGASAASSRC